MVEAEAEKKVCVFVLLLSSNTVVQGSKTFCVPEARNYPVW